MTGEDASHGPPLMHEWPCAACHATFSKGGLGWGTRAGFVRGSGMRPPWCAPVVHLASSPSPLLPPPWPEESANGGREVVGPLP